jgi:DNA helicase-2/ATP-dependent DNA helicase PcrA
LVICIWSLDIVSDFGFRASDFYINPLTRIKASFLPIASQSFILEGMDILKSLNPKQRQAVEAINGPVLVIAGPGSGKTRVLTHRVAYLINQGIPARNILAVTFTNKAAGEMRERIRKLFRRDLVPLQGTKSLTPFPMPAIGTFHAICAQILRKEAPKIGWRNNFIIYDDKDSLGLIKKCQEELEISQEQFKPKSIQESISSAKNELLGPEEYASQANGFWQETTAKVYSLYQTKLKQNNAFDFDDLLMMVAVLFKNQPQTLTKYQNQWHYILVDEYQDTNRTQAVLVNLLAQNHKNIFAVGDFDQAIYLWRGADFKNILNFEKEYPDCQVIILEENYRSTQNILAAAANVISRNIERKEKTLWTKNPEGYPIFFYEARNEKDEGNFIIREVNEKISAGGFKLADFAVLYRTNAQSRAIEEAFLMAGLPYKVVGSVKFYDRKEIKDLLAYLKIIQNPQDTVSLERIINVPPRGIGKMTRQRLSPRTVLGHQSEDSPRNAKLQSFFQLLENLQNKRLELSVTNLLKQVIKETKYQDYILSQDNGENRWENIEELFSVTQKYDLLPPEERLKTFLEEASLLQSSDEVETKKDLVNLMTLHCAKGLEFPVVFIVGCEEGIFPHSKSLIDRTQMEEERRLCYVGMTRAKKALYLLFAQRRLLFGSTIANPPSRFLSDLPEDLVEVKQNAPEKYFDEDDEERKYKYF